MTTLIFVRHGQSVSNLEQRFSGHHDAKLTELGCRQAEKTAELLRDAKIDKIYASDLSRAFDTAKYTARIHGLDVIPDRAFREVFAGDWEGHLYQEILDTYGDRYTQWITDIGGAHPNGGESVLELYARVHGAVERILREDAGKCVAVFTHATPVRMLACDWFGIAPREAAKVKFCSNASVSAVEYDSKGKPTLLCYGYDAHQGDLITTTPKGLV